MTSQTGPYIQSAAPEGFANLALGQPSPRLLPVSLLASACAERIRTDTDPLLLQYGTRAGDIGFRDALAEFVSAAHGIVVEPDTLMAAGSISLSLCFMCGLFGQRRRLVISEDPTYFLARRIFESSGMRVVGIPIDDHGLDVEALASALADGLIPDFVYCIPSFHNPTSTTMSAPRRAALIELAEQYNFMVVADEPYNLLYFETEVPAPMATLDGGHERVVSLASFSKILAPGLRTGWIQAAPALIARIADHGVISSGGALNPVITHMIGALLESGSLARHVDMLRTTYQTRKNALASALREYLPELVFLDPQGGYFLWARLPDDCSASALLASARRHDLAFVPGPACAVSADLDQYLRLSFAFYEPEELVSAVKTLRQVLAEQ